MDPPIQSKILVEAGKLVPSFAALRDDGSTACGCWIYSGCFNENGNNMARRDTSDPDNTGAYLKWAFSWPVNRRILYNRASADINGKAWDPSRKLIEWDGVKWSGYDVPDIAPTAKPNEVGPFIMNPEGVSRLFTRGLMRDGPFPAHYEPFESPVVNLVSPKVQSNPAARVFKGDLQQFADVESEEFPYAATSYRLTEHFHYLDQACLGQCGAAAGILRRDFGRARGGEKDHARRLGSRLVETRLGAGEGRGDEARAAAHLRRQDRPYRRHSVALGLHGRGEGGVWAQRADALCRGRQHRDAGI